MDEEMRKEVDFINQHENNRPANHSSFLKYKGDEAKEKGDIKTACAYWKEAVEKYHGYTPASKDALKLLKKYCK